MVKAPPRLVGLVGLITFAVGCAHIKREPCEFDAHIRLTEDANAECHKSPMRDHDGRLLNDTTEVLGCTGDTIISNGTRSNVGHEVGHRIEASCPKWAEGYFE